MDIDKILNIFIKISKLKNKYLKNINFNKKFIIDDFNSSLLENTYNDNEELILLNKLKINNNILNSLLKVLENELIFTVSIIKYLESELNTLNKTKESINVLKGSLLEYEHVNSDILLDYLFSDNNYNNMYFYSFNKKYNIIISNNKIEVDSYNETDLLVNFNTEFNLEEEYLKIKLNSLSFVNYIEFLPTYKTYDEYSISIETNGVLNESIYNNKKISIENNININKKCYSIIIKGPNIKNIINNIKVNISTLNNINNKRKAYAEIIPDNKLNNSFKTIFKNSEYYLFLTPINYFLDDKKNIDQIKSELLTFEKILPNKEYNHSFSDYKIVLYIENYNKVFNLPKIITS